MEAYWSAIFNAWENTICTEHEYFVAPAIYTPDVMAQLKEKIAEAEQIINGLQIQGRALSRNEKLYVERMRFMRYSYEITAGYISMVHAAATDCDYTRAAALGNKTLAVREKLTDMSGIITTYRDYKVGGAKPVRAEQQGYAWWPGEIRQYEELIPFINGKKGKLIMKLPLELLFLSTIKLKGFSTSLYVPI